MTDRARDAGVEAALRGADGLLNAASALAISLADLNGIDLPPLTGPALEPAQLRALAVLYLASELEQAGLVTAAEDLARLAWGGAAVGDLGAGGELVHGFWRGRNERATATERRAVFNGLFGADFPQGATPAERPPNDAFFDRFIDLSEALFNLDPRGRAGLPAGIAEQARVRTTARNLIANLQRVMGGINVFLAKELLATLHAALAILRHPDVQAAFGVHGPWQLVEAIERRLRRTPTEYRLHLRRAQAGMIVLAWLADVAERLDGGGVLVASGHPVIAAAWDWVDASLALSEAPVPAAAADAPRAESPWASLTS